MQIRLKSMIYGLILSLVSTVLCLAVVEVSLRMFYPKYEYAANADFNWDTSRIWRRKSNSHYTRNHPDTGRAHAVYHNNLTLRQHRNFEEQELRTAVNLGFFGDSYTENLRLPAPYSFTELTDYLLNTRVPQFNTLNLGVDGYGTDQSFLYYLDFKYAKELDYVFYVFCTNDLRNIYENNIYALDERGGLVRSQVPPSPWWVRSIRRFHTTYLVVDVLQRLRLTQKGLARRLDDEHHRQEYLS